jgi:hypothetical protein
VANNTTRNVYELLEAVNQQAVLGVLYNGDKTLRNAPTICSMLLIRSARFRRGEGRSATRRKVLGRRSYLIDIAMVEKPNETENQKGRPDRRLAPCTTECVRDAIVLRPVGQTSCILSRHFNLPGQA